MSEASDAGQGTAAAGSPPGSTTGDSGAPKGTVYTQEELKRLLDEHAEKKLRGQASAWDKDKKRLADLEAAEEKRKQAELSESEKAAKLAADLESERKARKALEEKETARLTKLAEQNDARRKALPKELHKFPLSSDPEQAAEQLSALEATVKTAPAAQVNGGAGHGQASAPEDRKAIEAKRRAWFFGEDKASK